MVQVEAKSGIQYILVLNEECESLPSTVIDSQHRRLLIAALTHIYMSGAPVKEGFKFSYYVSKLYSLYGRITVWLFYNQIFFPEEMWKFLTEAGLLEENDHSGRKLLTTTFTRQMYLQYSKVKYPYQLRVLIHLYKY